MKEGNIQEARENRKTKEMFLAELKESLGRYGVKNIECRLEGGALVIEQILGQGIRGLGYDKEAKSLWLCLDQTDPKTVKENQKWDANTILTGESQLPGIKIEKVGENTKIIIAADHPVAALARLLGKEDCVNIPGQYNGWKVNNPFKIKKETGELENEMEWDGTETELKVALTGITAQWEAGEWEDKAKQKLNVY